MRKRGDFLAWQQYSVNFMKSLFQDIYPQILLLSKQFTFLDPEYQNYFFGFPLVTLFCFFCRPQYYKLIEECISDSSA